jgi:hypothetical protein
MPRSAIAIGFGLIALAIYAATLAPEFSPRGDVDRDVLFQASDPIWLQRALSAVGGPESVSLTGLVMRGWSALPASPSLNLLSATLAAAAASTVVLIVWSVARPIVAVGLGLTFACSPGVWAHAVAAEGDVGTVLVTLLLGLALVCLAAPPGSRSPTRDAIAMASIVAAVAIDLTFVVVAATALIGLARAGRATRVLALASVGSIVVASIGLGLALRLLVGSAGDAAGAPSVVEVMTTMWQWGFDGEPGGRGMITVRAATLGAGLLTNVGVLGGVVMMFGLRASLWQAVGIAAILAAVLGPIPAPWDPDARLVPVLLVGWAIAGVALDRLWRWEAAGGRAVVVAFCLMLPAGQALRTNSLADTLVERPAGRMLAALVDSLQAPTAIVSERARFARLLIWANAKRSTAARMTLIPNQPSTVVAAMNAGQSVLATDRAAARLELSGISGPPLFVTGRSLEDVLRRRDPRSIVGLVATPGAFDGLTDDLQAVTQLGAGSLTAVTGREAFALLANPPYSESHLARSGTTLSVDTTTAASGVPASVVPLGGVKMLADDNGARIEAGSRELAHVSRGAVIAMWAPSPAAVEWAALERRATLTAEWRSRAWTFSRLSERRSCESFGNAGWSDVNALAASARVGVSLARGAGLRIYLARDRMLTPRVAAFAHRASRDIDVIRWDRANPAQAAEAAARLAQDGVEPPPDTLQFVWRVTLAPSAIDPALIAIGLSGQPDWARARVLPGSVTSEAVLCAGVAGARLFARSGQRVEAVSLIDNDTFVAGWQAVQFAGAERWRRLSASEGDLLVRLDVPEVVTVAIAARTRTPAGVPWGVGLAINGVSAGQQPLQPTAATYEWQVPQERWQRGTNHLRLSLSAGPSSSLQGPPPAVEITELQFRRAPG